MAGRGGGHDGSGQGSEEEGGEEGDNFLKRNFRIF
jgi:hypothetical protein